PERGRELRQTPTSRRPDARLIGVELNCAFELSERKQRAVGFAERHERMAGADDAHLARFAHERRQFGFGLWPSDLLRLGAYAAGPVLPLHERNIPARTCAQGCFSVNSSREP